MFVHHFLLPPTPQPSWLDMESYVENHRSSMNTNIVIQNLSVLKLPTEGKEGFVSMGGTANERVYYRANPDGCGLRYEDGDSAGPMLPTCSIVNLNINDCNPMEELLKLDVIKALTMGSAVQFYLPHQPWGLYDNLAIDRSRRSSATGIVIVDENYLVVGSFGMQKVYLYEYKFIKNQGHKGRNTLTVALLDQADTEGRIDLLDFDGKDLILASVLNLGTQEIFKLDLAKKSIRKHYHVFSFKDEIKERCHEAALYPSQNAHILAAGSFHGKFDDPKIKIRFYDYEHNKTLADLHMASNQATRGKPKGFRFIDTHHMIASFSTYRIKPPFVCSDNVTELVGSSVALIKMNFSLDDIANGKRGPADDSEFTVLASYSFDHSNVDGLAYHDGIAIVADQFNDCVLIFNVNTNAKKPLALMGRKYGYLMPHGVFLSKDLDLMAVTIYGDNLVILQPLSKALDTIN